MTTQPDVPDNLKSAESTDGKFRQTIGLARLLAVAEQDVREGRTRPVADFLREFKRGKGFQR
jgi:hypothetical protein